MFEKDVGGLFLFSLASCWSSSFIITLPSSDDETESDEHEESSA